MISGTLQADDAINGGQLCDEIQTALGIDISGSYGFFPPRAVEIAGFDDHADAIMALIAAHVPTPGYVPLADREAAQAAQAAALQRAQDACTILNSPVATVNQASRDALARILGVVPLQIALDQQAQPGDIQPLAP